MKCNLDNSAFKMVTCAFSFKFSCSRKVARSAISSSFWRRKSRDLFAASLFFRRRSQYASSFLSSGTGLIFLTRSASESRSVRRLRVLAIRLATAVPPLAAAAAAAAAAATAAASVRNESELLDDESAAEAATAADVDGSADVEDEDCVAMPPLLPPRPMAVRDDEKTDDDAGEESCVYVGEADRDDECDDCEFIRLRSVLFYTNNLLLIKNYVL